MEKLTTEKFTRRAIEVHGDKYNYSKAIYLHSFENISIICKKHGDFQQSAHAHLAGRGCKKCGIIEHRKKTTLNTKEFIEKANSIHGIDAFDYTCSNYQGAKKTIQIKCHKHGIFNQLPHSHLSGHGCKSCAIEKDNFKKTLSLAQFIEHCNLIHKNRYDYSLVTEYVDSRDIFNIICPVHGIFKKKGAYHLNGRGCKKCSSKQSREKKTFSLRQFINKSNLIHNNKYNYSLVKEYSGCRCFYKIKCHRHGIFTQSGSSHSRGHGCPYCNKSKGEIEIMKILINKKIKFTHNKTFYDCKNPQTNYKLRFDFYIPGLNLCIEYDGEQHFKPIDKFGGDTALESSKYRDKIKDEYCVNNNIHLIRIRFRKISSIEKTIEKALLLDFNKLENKVLHL